jgi:DNA-directed RNA polymerase subunit RPC12/RpoP
MAARFTFTCSHCGFRVESWSDSNPYIRGPNGRRHHYYHPGEDQQLAQIAEKILGHPPTPEEIEELRRLHGGNESDYVCTACQKISRRDPSKDKLTCRRCGSKQIIRTSEVAGQPCFACNQGRFDNGPMTAIS